MNKIILALGGIILVSNFLKPLSTGDKQVRLRLWATDNGNYDFINILGVMNKQEIEDTFEFVFNYHKKGKRLDKNSRLYISIANISEKYNVFT